MATQLNDYNSLDASRIAGLTLRQLQWFDERNVLHATRVRGCGGTGRPKRYGSEDVLLLSVISAIKRKGFTLQRFRPLLPEIKRRLRDYVFLEVGKDQLFMVLFLATKSRVEWFTDMPSIFAALSNSTRPVILLDIQELREKVRA